MKNLLELRYIESNKNQFKKAKNRVCVLKNYSLTYLCFFFCILAFLGNNEDSLKAALRLGGIVALCCLCLYAFGKKKEKLS